MIHINELSLTCNFVRTAAYQVFLRGHLPVYAGTPFPRGICGWVSVALGAVLATKYPEEAFFYVNGVCGNQSHAWIEYENYIIDITADQFDEIDKSIFISIKEDSGFHKKYQVTNSVHINEEFMCVYLNYKEESLIFQEYYAIQNELTAE